MANEFCIMTETSDGVFVFGEDNRFYNIEYPDKSFTEDMLFVFSEDEAKEVLESLFNFEYESLEMEFAIVPKTDLDINTERG
jgi:hypothetical protein